MPDAGEIKAKVTIEYDGSGLEKAKEDLASLADVGGNVEQSLSGTNDALAGTEEQATKSATAAKSFNEVLAELPKAVEEGDTALSDMNATADEHTQAMEEATTAHKDFQSTAGDTADVLQEVAPAMRLTSEQVQVMNERFDVASSGMSDFYENTAVVLDALQNPEPFALIGQYLQETGQTWGDFTSSLGTNNVAMLEEMASKAGLTGDHLDMLGSQVQTVGQTFVESAGSADEFTRQFLGSGEAIQSTTSQVGGLNEVVAASSKQLDEAGASAITWAKGLNEFGGVGEALYGPSSLLGDAATRWSGFLDSVFQESSAIPSIGESIGSAFSGMGEFFSGGVAMNAMMAVQMVGTAIDQAGQQIYNFAAIAEGPAAHSTGTFTGTMDALTQSAQNMGAQFSESYGQQIIPALNSMNYGMSQSANLGGDLGGTMGGVSDFLMNYGNLTMGFGAFFSGFPQLGTDLITAGTEGFINQGAQAIGMPQPFQGPGPQSQAQINYQQQFAQLPQTTAANAKQLQLQADQLFANASDPNYLSAQDQYQAAQQAYARAQANYNSQNYISPQQALMNYQEKQYDVQQNAAYDQQMQDQGGLFGTGYYLDWNQGIPGAIGRLFQNSAGQQSLYGGGTQAPSTPFDGISGFFGGIGQGMQDFFTKGFGSDLMQFFGGTGGTGGGQTYGQAIWGGISNLFGGIGNLFSGGGAPQSYGGGCFPAGTLVMMADGSEKPIETLQVGEQVMSHDGEKRVITPILALIKPPPKRVYELTFADGNTLTLTDSHPIATLQGWKSLSPEATSRENPDLVVALLQIGGSVCTANGVTSLVAIQPRDIVQVYNITVSDPHTFYANNILVHNKTGLASDQVGQQVSEQFAGITLPHIDLSGISGQLAGAFGGITLPHMDLSGISGALAGAFGGITMPQVPDIGGMINGALGGMFGGISMPQIPDIGSMINGAMSSMFGGISLPNIPDIGGMLNGALSTMFGGISLPSVPDVGSMISGAMSSMFGGISIPSVPDVGSMINGAMSGMFGGISLPSIPNIAGSINSMLSSALSGISIPFFASGVENFGGGLAVVGDAGPELVSLPSGSSVYPMSTGAGISGGGVSPLSFGGGGSMPQSVSVIVNLDSQSMITALGLPFASTIRVASGMRAY